MIEQKYPVEITETMKYLVWVEAESQEDAVAQLDGCEHDWIEGETAQDAWLEVSKEAPEYWEMPNNDAHVNRWKYGY